MAILLLISSTIPLVADTMPVEPRFQVNHAELQRGNRFYVLAGRSYEIEFSVRKNDRGGIVSLSLDLPEPVFLHAKERSWTGRDSSHATSGQIFVRTPGSYPASLSAVDHNTGFRTSFDFLIVAVPSLEGLATTDGNSSNRAAEAILGRDMAKLDAPSSRSAGIRRITGVVTSYPDSTGRQYPLRGVQVQLFGFNGTLFDLPLSPVIHTVESTKTPNCGLNIENNFVQGGSWYHANDDMAGYFDFGNVDTSAAPILFVLVTFRFTEGGTGYSNYGQEQLVVIDGATGLPATMSAVLFPPPSDTNQFWVISAKPLGDEEVLNDEAAHVLLDMSRTFGYMRDCAGIIPGPVEARLNLNNLTNPNSVGKTIHLNKWTNNYLNYEKTYTIVHEYFHAVHWYMRGGSLPPRAAGDTNHGGCGNSNSADALMEGWAAYGPTRIFNSPIYRWGSTGTPSSTTDFSLAKADQNANCDRDEYTFASTLWQLWKEGNADPNVSFRQIAGTLDKHDPNLVDQFYEAFVTEYPALCKTAYDVFKNHNIDYPNRCAGGVTTPSNPTPAPGSSVPAGSALSWSPVPGAASYDVYYGESNPPPFLTTTAATSFTPTGMTAGKTFYWRIVANGSSSPTWSFSTAAATSGLRFVPVRPCRVADTRNAAGPFGGPPVPGGSARSFTIPSSSCGIPATAQAFSLNITVVPQGPLSYLTIFPSGQTQPAVSTLNSFDGRIKANAAIVPAGAGGAVSLFVTNTTDVVVDINGYFVSPANAPANALQYFALTPCRVSDTRNATGALGGPSLTGGVPRTIPVASSCGVPSAALAYSLNFTAVPKGPLAYISTWPSGQSQPLVSTLNAFTGAITANAAIVPAGSSGSIDVFASNATDLVIDINGYFAPPASGGLSLYPVTPCRISDTRNATGIFGGPRLSNGQTRSWPVSSSNCALPATAKAYALNATVVPQGPLAYLTLWPTGSSQPNVSTLNAFDGSIVANAAIVPASTTGSVNSFVTNFTDLILDVSGYFAP